MHRWATRAPQIQPSNWAVGDFKCFVNRLDSALSNRMRGTRENLCCGKSLIIMYVSLETHLTGHFK